MELYASACTLSRWDAELQGDHNADPAQHVAAEGFLKYSRRRIRNQLAALHTNDDAALNAATEAALRHGPGTRQ